MMAVTLIFSFLLTSVAAEMLKNDFTPGQVHIAFGENESSIIVTWSTLNATSKSIVKYHSEKKKDIYTQNGSSKKFVDGGEEKRSQFIHKVTLTDLKPNTKYYYAVGSSEAWSEKFYFKTIPAGEDWGPSFAVYGDMGLINAKSLPFLVKESAQGMYDAILHVGDFAYDLHAYNGQVGDTFMEVIQPIASSVPYMTCVGNHENAYNFSNYRARFNMPKDNGRMYYSFNEGPVHVISLSTEFYYFPYYGIQPIFDQYKWLQHDLKEANKPENRAKRPWIVTFGHRPMYCSDTTNDDCTSKENLVRTGAPPLGIPGFEDLLYDQGVDVAIWAHEHSYERLWPVYNEQVKNGSYKYPYTNPKGITHIITGSAGCSERHEYFVKNPQPWSAFRSFDYGYTRMKFANKTHLHMEQVSVDKNGTVIDSFTLIKDMHGPYRQLFGKN